MLPSGMILLWYGALIDVPSGYVICDGNNGTPDLRDKFVVGAGSTYAPGTTGGAATHTHTFTSSGHTHTLPPGANIASGANYSSTSDSETVTGTTDTGNGLPPYHALFWIMKT